MENTINNPENTSGQGSTALVPEEIKGWNWGAFFLSWIWSIGHQTWIGLIALAGFIPYLGIVSLAMSIVLGIKGNEWAWQNRRWESVEQFRATQKVWAIWGAVIFAVCLVVGIIVGIMVAMVGFGHAMRG